MNLTAIAGFKKIIHYANYFYHLFDINTPQNIPLLYKKAFMNIQYV